MGMYNGIGLTTQRGSGTNGYVQRNLSHVLQKKDRVNYKTEEEIKWGDKANAMEPNEGILQHQRKRKMELKCLELEELLQEQGYKEEEIAEKVDAYRKMLIEKDAEKHGEEDVDTDEFGRAVYKDSHKMAQAQKEKNERLKAAFGIAPEFAEGSSFNENRQAIEEANRLEREARQKKYDLIESGDEEDSKGKKK